MSEVAELPRPAVVLTVYGQPAPQGSKRPFVNKHTGRAQVIEQNKVPVDRWRSDVKDAALKLAQDIWRFECPVEVRMVFSFERPASHYGTGRNAAVLKASSPARPVGRDGDLDKLARSTCDALTAAGIWKDDKLVAEFARLAKVFCGEDPDALDVPGAVITIRPVT